MKKNGKIAVAIGTAVVLVAAVLVLILKTAGGHLDVVGKESIASFERILNAAADRVEADEANAGWSLEAPDASVRFIWSGDYGKSPVHDVMLEFDVAPFVNAGLDTDQLPENYAFYEGMLMVGTRLGSGVPAPGDGSTPLAAYEQIVGQYRGIVGYHTALDHFNVNLGDGNLFEWAKDMQINDATGGNQDKDIVFVLNPEPLIAAGVDPEKVEGWVYTTVSVDIDGKPAELYKFLKPFNLQ